MLPSAYPEVGDRPSLRRLLEVQVDMQLADLGTLLCLPREEPGLGGGCNLTAATLAANIIAGASVLFWDSTLEALKPGPGRGKRFTGLMTAHYPWSSQDAVDAQLGAKLLWDHTRNPLSHTLGVGKQAQLFPGIPTDETRRMAAQAPTRPARRRRRPADELLPPTQLDEPDRDRRAGRLRHPRRHARLGRDQDAARPVRRHGSGRRG